MRSSVENAEPECVTSEIPARGEVVALEIADGAHPAAYVDEAHAAGAAHRHPGAVGDELSDSRRPAPCAEPNDHAARAPTAAAGRQLLDEPRCPDTRAAPGRRVRRARRATGAQAGPPIVVARVDQVHTLGACAAPR